MSAWGKAFNKQVDLCGVLGVGLTRREAYIHRPVTPEEFGRALQAAGVGDALTWHKKAWVLAGKKGRLRVSTARWQLELLGRKPEGTRITIGPVYPGHIWAWIALGVFPVFLAQYIYDQKMRSWTRQIAHAVQQSFPAR